MKLRSMAAFAALGVCAMLGGFVGSLVMEAGAPVQAQEGGNVVSAGEFRLTGKDGQVRARLALDDDGAASLDLLDGKGQVRLRLSAENGKSVLSLHDGEGNARLLGSVDTDKDGETLLVMSDATGRPRVTTHYQNGQSLLAMTDAKGHPYVTLLATDGNMATFQLKSLEDKQQVVLLTREDQATVQCGSGKGEVFISALEDSRPVFAMRHDDKLRLRAMLGALGVPELLFLNEDREATWRAGQ